MASYDQQEILLETGTNEVEIAEFFIGTHCFGVNVAKIKEFVPLSTVKITKDPNAPKSMLGVFMLRGELIPLIDLSIHLLISKQMDNKRQVIIVTDFNNKTTGFVVDNINRIHRVSWEDLEEINPVMKKHSNRMTASVHIGDIDLILLDLEYIINEIFPENIVVTNEDKEDQRIDKRRTTKIVIADDSSIAREAIQKNLAIIGYTQIMTFENGKDVYYYLEQLKKRFESNLNKLINELHLVITDIEMPQMDGLTLCHKIKKELHLSMIPVIIFSSLISDQMAIKCESVGADGFATKPNFPQLIQEIDSFVFRE